MSKPVFYSIRPFDTLFFRGSLPLEAGKGCSPSLFPPTTESLIGAFRTLILKDNGISLDDFKKGKSIPEAGTYGHSDQNFQILGIFIKKEDIVYAKAPCALFSSIEGDKTVAALASPMAKNNTLGISSSCSIIPLAPPNRDENQKPFSNAWVDVEMFTVKDKRVILPSEKNLIVADEVSEFLYCSEVHVGIALDKHRRSAEEHKLYSASHIRLKEGVSIVVKVSKELPIAEKGVMRLGGEEKLSIYEKLELPQKYDGNEKCMYVSTVPIKVASDTEAHMFATSRPVLIGGWDYAAHFYKKNAMYYPAGAVFDCNMDGRALPWII